MNKLPAKRNSSVTCFFPTWNGPVRLARCLSLPMATLLSVESSLAQEALRSSLAGQAAAESRRIRPESLPFTFKTGELRLLVTPSVGVDWNDNIDSLPSNSKSDVIAKPMVNLNLSFPVTDRNLLNLNVGVGYDYYFQHPEYSGVRLQSGSELSFDIYVQDFWINLHDRFHYTQDSAGQSAVSGTGRYGGFDNTAGLSTTWALQDVTLSLEYDHNNFLSSSSQFDYVNHGSEMVIARAGFRFNPQLTAGAEGTASFTAYDQNFLNDNTSLSGGLYAEWQPGLHFHVQPRAGYTAYLFEQTSPFIRAVDQNAWYAALSVRHDVTEAISYSLNAGHEIRLGIQADTVDVWFFRPMVDWRIIKHTSLQTSLFYEHGKQEVQSLSGSLAEAYDWYGGDVSIRRQITNRFTLGLHYRLTLRSSSSATREYTQNLVGLQLTYQLP